MVGPRLTPLLNSILRLFPHVAVAAFFGALASAGSLSWGQVPDFGKFGRQPLGGLSLSGDPVTISAEYTLATEQNPALLFVTAQIESGWHLYALDQGALPDGEGPMPTSVKLVEQPHYKLVGGFRALEAPKTHIDERAWPGLELREHERRVTWVAPVELSTTSDANELAIRGVVKGQACKESCVPIKAEFTARLGKGKPLPAAFQLDRTAPPATGSEGSAAANSSAPSSHGTAAWSQFPAANADAVAYDIQKINLQAGAQPDASSTVPADDNLLYYLATAFLGGMILNIMPCVLPVIGLKIMSFVQQAGESRGQAIVLNLWYSLGIVAVFMALATMAAFFQQAWGSQFASAQFNIVLLTVVFAMALSLLGVWEIPIPGFIGSGVALEYADREGPLAAFLKGILTTLLATPCTGPFMATALAWVVRQSPAVMYAVFGMLGIGMATPYLVLGAFPSLVRVLPKPGMWMETFKKGMGIVLLATVVWMLSFLKPPLVVPSVALLLAVGAICGWMARTPTTASLEQRIYSWAIAGMATLVAALGSYGVLYQKVMLPRYENTIEAQVAEQLDAERRKMAAALNAIDGPQALAAYRQQLALEELNAVGKEAWQPFTLERLGRLTMQHKRTVLVDFTADWCFNCKTLERLVLKTDEITTALADAGVVTMVADYTHEPEWMTETILALQSNGVPVIAIFPAERPYEPIVFRGAYTKADLLKAIGQATGNPPRMASLAP